MVPRNQTTRNWSRAEMSLCMRWPYNRDAVNRATLLSRNCRRAVATISPLTCRQSKTLCIRSVLPSLFNPYLICQPQFEQELTDLLF